MSLSFISSSQHFGDAKIGWGFASEWRFRSVPDSLLSERSSWRNRGIGERLRCAPVLRVEAGICGKAPQHRSYRLQFAQEVPVCVGLQRPEFGRNFLSVMLLKVGQSAAILRVSETSSKIDVSSSMSEFGDELYVS
jgi:hypothetical protein